MFQQSMQRLTFCDSRQIRPPIYSLKQSRLRKRRVIRYAMLYFIMLIVFVALIVGPVVARKYITLNFTLPLELMQPTGQTNNDTHNSAKTGNFINGMMSGGATGTGAGGSGASQTSGSSGASSSDTNAALNSLLSITARAAMPTAFFA